MEDLLTNQLGMEIDPASEDGLWYANKNGITVTIFRGYGGRWEAGIEVTCYRDEKLLYKKDFILDSEKPELSKQIVSEQDVINVLRKDIGVILAL